MRHWTLLRQRSSRTAACRVFGPAHYCLARSAGVPPAPRGRSPLFVKEVIRILSDLRGRGLGLLIAEQNIGFLEVATRVFVLEGGRIRFSGTVAEMTDNEALRRAYFGLK